jgi:hypothetical protein
LTRETRAGCPGIPVLQARRPRIVTVVLKGDKRRPSGQDPGARVFYGLSSHKLSGITGSPRPSSQPREAGSASRPGTATPDGRLRLAASPHPAASRATGRQRPAPASHPHPRAKFSGRPDRPRRAGFSQRLYVVILYGYWTRAEARCRRPAGPGAADYVLADGLPAGFPGPRLPGAGDLLLQLLEEPD